MAVAVALAFARRPLCGAGSSAAARLPGLRSGDGRAARRGSWAAAGAGRKKNMPRGVKKENLPQKICVTCGRPFTWRKKWERCWDEVTTCSKSCNAQRRRAKGSNGKAPPETNGADPAAVSH